MQNLWGDIKRKGKIIVPNTIIEEQGKILLEMTEQLVEIEIIEISDNRLKNAEFTFAVSLNSYKMENYEYDIFKVEYDLEIYPVRIILDSNIQNIEVDKKFVIGSNEYNGLVLEAKDEDEFIILLGSILSSEEITDAVRSIMYLAEQIGVEPDFEIPF